jgi:hypothetical protein
MDLYWDLRDVHKMTMYCLDMLGIFGFAIVEEQVSTMGVECAALIDIMSIMNFCFNAFE